MGSAKVRHDWIEMLCCVAFALASLGGWLWLYWDMTYPATQLG